MKLAPRFAPWARRVGAACAVLALATACVACGAQGTEDTQSQSLTIAWWGSQGRNDKQKQVDDLFLQEHEGVNIDGQFSQYGDYWQKLATGAAGHQMPDIVAMDLPYLNQYVDNGLIRDLTPYIDDGTLDVADVPDAVLDTGMAADGGIYAMSSGVNAPAVIYDRTLLDSLGIEVPDDWTLDDFTDICRQVYERTGTKTNAGYYRDANVLEYLLRADGTTLYSQEGLAVQDPAAVEPYFAMFQDGIEEGWHLDPTIFTEINLSVMNQDPLVSYVDNAHRSWCAFGWSNSLGGMQSLVANGDDLALAPWPSADVARSNYVHPAQYFAISRDCDDPRLAAQWIDFYLNDARANRIMGVDRGMPANAAMVEEIMDDLGDDDRESIAFVQDVVTPASTTINPPAPAKAVKINAAIMPSIQEQLLYRRIDAHEAAERFVAQAGGVFRQ